MHSCVQRGKGEQVQFRIGFVSPTVGRVAIPRDHGEREPEVECRLDGRENARHWRVMVVHKNRSDSWTLFVVQNGERWVLLGA